MVVDVSDVSRVVPQ